MKKLVTLAISILLLTTVGCEIIKDNDNHPHEHNYILTNTTSSTCSEKGKSTYTCFCGDIKEIELDLAAHPGSEKWYSDLTHHWLIYSCEHSDDETKQPHNIVDNVCSDCGFATYEQAVNNTIAKTYFLGKGPWRMDMYWENLDPTIYGRLIISTENIFHGKANIGDGIEEGYMIRKNDSTIEGYIRSIKTVPSEWQYYTDNINYYELDCLSSMLPNLLPSNDKLEIISYENSVFTVKDYNTYEITIKDGLIVKVRNVALLAVFNFSYDSDLTVELPPDLKIG